MMITFCNEIFEAEYFIITPFHLSVKIYNNLTVDIFAVNKSFNLFVYVNFDTILIYIFYICHKCIKFDKINI